MRRNLVFGKGRGWRAEDDRYRDLHLGPRRGAGAGEYAAQQSSEYSDFYYDPGGRYATGGNDRRERYARPAYEPRRADDELDTERASTIKARAYRDLGPRGYRRSDARIHEDVCQALTEDPHLDASTLDVEVKDGEVTLSGTTGSRHDKRYAEHIAEMVTGVRDVHNRLRIGVHEDDLAQKGEPSSPMAPQDRTA
ncbi:MAG TPA: BON domain-containing protein [Steroidobacteraceae bacterium]|nr:BON domain-containing protein [Steroidobacteraceae bacterium]